MLAIDTETTGKDLHHSARPFLVSTCDENGDQLYWEWDVDPLTREVAIPKEDVEHIQQLINEADLIIGQNIKFDVTALEKIGIVDWPWGITHDTLMSGHLLASNEPHNLTDMCINYLGIDIGPYEDRLEEAVVKCRRLCRSRYKDWLIAKEGVEGMPSAKSSGKEDSRWKYDMWLPRALAKEMDLPKDHKWWTITRDYNLTDTAVLPPLFKRHKEEMMRVGNISRAS